MGCGMDCNNILVIDNQKQSIHVIDGSMHKAYLRLPRDCPYFLHFVMPWYCQAWIPVSMDGIMFPLLQTQSLFFVYAKNLFAVFSPHIILLFLFFFPFLSLSRLCSRLYLAREKKDQRLQGMTCVIMQFLKLSLG